MAFLKQIGNIVKQATSSSPSVYQAIRCMSSSKVFVGGLNYAVDDQCLRETFGSFGEIIDAKVILDRESGRSRGFGFVTFASSDEASGAISAMDGKDLQGRFLRVNYATDRAGGFRGGFGSNSGGYYGGGARGGYGGSSVGYSGGTWGSFGGSGSGAVGDGAGDSGYDGVGSDHKSDGGADGFDKAFQSDESANSRHTSFH